MLIAIVIKFCLSITNQFQFSITWNLLLVTNIPYTIIPIHIDSLWRTCVLYTARYKINLIWLIDWLIIPYQLTVGLSHISQQPPAFISLARPKSVTDVIRKFLLACFSRCHAKESISISVFTPLHGMQSRSSDEISICLSNVCIVTKLKKICPDFYTMQKII